jgi:hypothetical protein
VHLTPKPTLDPPPEPSPLGPHLLWPFTSLLSSRLMLAGLIATTCRQPSSGWKLHSHNSGPWPLEHSERRPHLSKNDQCLSMTLTEPLGYHRVVMPIILKP